MNKPDLDSKENITLFIHKFYNKLLSNHQISPIFIDVAEINLSAHLPLICSYWEKLLLGENVYNRHTMNIHRALHAKHSLKKEDFELWLTLFNSTIDDSFSGEKSEKAKRIAQRIASNMLRSLNDETSNLT